MPLLLIALFIGVPILEITAITQVQSFLGWPTTILILVLGSILGAYLVRLQGALAWRRFTQAMAEGRLPAEEVVDGALILFGGALLLTPGFLTDAVGLGLVFTPTRRLVNGLVRRRATAAALRPGGGLLGGLLGGGPRERRTPERPEPTPPQPPRRPRQPGVIDVEVVDVQRNPPDPEGGR